MRTAIILAGLLLTATLLVAAPGATAVQCVSTQPDVQEACQTALDTGYGAVGTATDAADCFYYTAPAYWDDCA